MASSQQILGVKTETIWEGSGGRLLRACLAIFIAYAVASCLAGLPIAQSPQFFPSVLLIILGVIPLIIYMRKRNLPPLPFLPLIGLFYVLCFGFPSLFSQHISLGTASPKATYLCCLGLIIFYACFYSFRWKQMHTLPFFKLPKRIPLSRLKSCAWVLLFLHMGWVLIPRLHNLVSVRFVLAFSGYLAYGFFYYLIKTHQARKIEKYVAFGCCFAIECVVALSSSHIMQFVALIVFLLLVHLYVCKRVYWKLVCLCMAAFVIFNPIKLQYRRTIWIQGTHKTELTKIERIHSLTRTAWDYYFAESPNPNWGEDLLCLARRIGASYAIFSRVVQETPDRVPFWGGETYLPLLTKPIPRILWSGKPKEYIGQAFGHRYGLISRSNTATCVNLPWITEMYANFGVIGIIVGMGLVGILFAFLDRTLNNPRMGMLESIFGIGLLYPLCNQGHSFSLVVGNIPLLALLFYLLFKLLFQKSL